MLLVYLVPKHVMPQFQHVLLDMLYQVMFVLPVLVPLLLVYLDVLQSDSSLELLLVLNVIKML